MARIKTTLKPNTFSHIICGSGLLTLVLLLFTVGHANSAVNNDDDVAPAATLPVNDNDPITLHSDHILQAQLTAALDDKSPTDRLGSHIFMNERGLIRIYLFTEMEGLNNQRVFFDWYLNDERQARVTVRPHLEQMRASTSKFIDRNMLGDWQVKVVMSDDTLLTSARFEVLSYDDDRPENYTDEAQDSSAETSPE